MVGRWLLALLFLAAGSLHLLLPAMFVKIMPHYLPEPALLVQISGLAEIFGGIGLLIPKIGQAAAWGLILLLIAVLPANVNMALQPAAWPSIPPWLLWARLPLQIPLIYWAFLYTNSSL